MPSRLGQLTSERSFDSQDHRLSVSAVSNASIPSHTLHFAMEEPKWRMEEVHLRWSLEMPLSTRTVCEAWVARALGWSNPLWWRACRVDGGSSTASIVIAMAFFGNETHFVSFGSAAATGIGGFLFVYRTCFGRIGLFGPPHFSTEQ